jgi:hypothetical protein
VSDGDGSEVVVSDGVDARWVDDAGEGSRRRRAVEEDVE